jgi:hypothetical protein
MGAAEIFAATAVKAQIECTHEHHREYLLVDHQPDLSYR